MNALQGAENYGTAQDPVEGKPCFAFPGRLWSHKSFSLFRHHILLLLKRTIVLLNVWYIALKRQHCSN
jgi:hypothetical protein